eukprot:TRINITY_DN16250_c0_g1_i3.p5 TRINITY_DN16250_c0_g1~~TRINITY_DN16250_c0_g1_i3.p5  ORF type:complete len:233 (+),score=-10.51 TRINITY_DN16250_c0_g1_i3:3224-3922(+)
MQFLLEQSKRFKNTTSIVQIFYATLTPIRFQILSIYDFLQGYTTCTFTSKNYKIQQQNNFFQGLKWGKKFPKSTEIKIYKQYQEQLHTKIKQKSPSKKSMSFQIYRSTNYQKVIIFFRCFYFNQKKRSYTLNQLNNCDQSPILFVNAIRETKRKKEKHTNPPKRVKNPQKTYNTCVCAKTLQSLQTFKFYHLKSFGKLQIAKLCQKISIILYNIWIFKFLKTLKKKKQTLFF